MQIHIDKKVSRTFIYLFIHVCCRSVSPRTLLSLESQVYLPSPIAHLSELAVLNLPNEISSQTTANPHPQILNPKPPSKP